MSSGAFDTLRTVVAVVRRSRVRIMAASLAYFALGALAPLALLAMIGLSAVVGWSQVIEAVELASGRFAPQTRWLVSQVFTDSAGWLHATVLGVGVLVWNAVRLFHGVNDVFVTVYDEPTDQSIAATVAETVLVLGVVLFAIASLAVGGVALSFLATHWLWLVASPVLLFVALAVSFVPIYYVFPGPDVSLRETLPGATFAAGIWAVSGIVFRAYASAAQSVRLYGIAGVALLFLSWLYLGGLALYVGAALNAVLAGRADASSGAGTETISSADRDPSPCPTRADE